MNILFLLIACFLTYLPILGSEFKFDDFEYIDPALGHHYSSLIELFTQSKNLHYNPLNYLFNDILFSVWGHQHAWPFHLLNIILFSLNVLLLYKIALLLTKSAPASFLAAIFFCLHPMNAEMVNQVVFNTVFVAALCVQLVVIIFDKYLTAPNINKLIIALAISLVSILTLETSMILPLYLFFWAYFVRGKDFKSAIRSTLCFWILAAVLFLTWFLMSCGNTLSGDVLPRFKYLALTPVIFVGSLISLVIWYLQKLIVPIGHVWIYGIQPLDTPTSVRYVLLLISLAVVVYFYRLRIFSSKNVVFLLGWFFAGFIFLVPGSFAHPENGLVIEPYWFYVSSMGFFVLAGLFLIVVKNKMSNIAFLSLVGVLCLILALMTQRFNIIAKTQKSYSEYWFQTSVNSIALTTLAKLTYDENNYPLAVQYFELYLKRYAWSPYSRDHADMIYANLAAIYIDMGDIGKAKDMASKALMINTNNARAYAVCGVVSFKERDFKKAEEYFERAVELAPTDVLNQLNLQELYCQLGQINKATNVLEALLKMDLTAPDRINVLSKLAVLQFLHEDKERSMATIERLLNEQQNATAYLVLSKAFRAAGELEPARIFLEQGLKMYPQEKELQVLMAEVLSQQSER